MGKRSNEFRLKGQSVSRGIAIGTVLCLHGGNRQFAQRSVSAADIDNEVRRFRDAVGLAAEQLKAAIADNGDATDAARSVIEPQLAMLTDPVFAAEVEADISDGRRNAEWAVKRVADRFVADLKALSNERQRERFIDVEDISERLIDALGGPSTSLVDLTGATVLAADELRPSTLAELNSPHLAALVTEHGGWTSHSFILARELGIPAVAGVKRLMRKVRSGAEFIVDGYSGEVIVDPDPQTLEIYRNAGLAAADVSFPAPDTSEFPTTTDGRSIIIRANLDIPSVYEQAEQLGARGIGLYRSEFLFKQFEGFPNEAEQYKAYCAIGDFAGSDGVKIRTFDLGAGQLLAGSRSREKNPALGLRAVRLSLACQDPFRQQLRAIVRAAFERRIEIVIPMVSGVTEIRAVREMLDQESRELRKDGIRCDIPRVGAMIELPSAVLMIKEILEEADFIALGTNDLVQYTLGADRDNELVADWFRTLHPAVIRSIKSVVDAGESAGKPTVVCGEMAGSPYYVPVLVGLGAKELSMNVNSIAKVRRMIAGISFEEARLMAGQILSCRSPEEAEAIVDERMRADWAGLLPQFPQIRAA